MNDRNEIIIWGKGLNRKLGQKIKKITRQLLMILRIKKANLEIFLLSEKKMTSLKKRFLPSKNDQADVLAFPEPPRFPHPESSNRQLGQIYLNRKLCRGKFDNLIFLLIHGLLHLLGYRHQKKNDILKMENLERKLWRQISSLV